MICKYCLPFRGLPFYFVDNVLWCAGFLNCREARLVFNSPFLSTSHFCPLLTTVSFSASWTVRLKKNSVVGNHLHQDRSRLGISTRSYRYSKSSLTLTHTYVMSRSSEWTLRWGLGYRWFIWEVIPEDRSEEELRQEERKGH